MTLFIGWILNFIRGGDTSETQETLRGKEAQEEAEEQTKKEQRLEARRQRAEEKRLKAEAKRNYRIEKINALKEKVYAVASKRKYLFLIIAAVIVGYLVFKFVR